VIGDELIAELRLGMYRKMKMTTNAKRIAGKIHRFWMVLLKVGCCWKIESLRVRVAKRLNLWELVLVYKGGI
jgi:hypothetical protein